MLWQPIDMDAELAKLEALYGKGNISEADLMSHIMYPQVRGVGLGQSVGRCYHRAVGDVVHGVDVAHCCSCCVCPEQCLFGLLPCALHATGHARPPLRTSLHIPEVHTYLLPPGLETPPTL
jgi:hypothetical protein